MNIDGDWWTKTYEERKVGKVRNTMWGERETELKGREKQILTEKEREREREREREGRKDGKNTQILWKKKKKKNREKENTKESSTVIAEISVRD